MKDEVTAKLEEIIKGQNELLKVLQTVDKPVFVQVGDKKKILRINEISFVTTNPKGLDIYTSDGNKYINFDSISGMAEDFKAEQRLMKTHKSFIVNLNQIDTVRVVPGGRELTFKGLNPDITAKVTSDVLEEFQKRFGKD
jgi:DNA-binding LytR/AlgR family response regulator